MGLEKGTDALASKGKRNGARQDHRDFLPETSRGRVIITRRKLSKVPGLGKKEGHHEMKRT